MSIKENIRELLINIVKEAPYNLLPEQVQLDEPNNLDYGDYASNVALRLTKVLKKSPKLVAQELIEKVKSHTDAYELNELNGFINIRIKDEILFQELKNIDSHYAVRNLGHGQPVLLEYVSANPTGPLHIGHGRWAVIGDILARVLVECGYEVTREFYVNDLGNQINNFINSVKAVKNAQPIPEDGYHGAYIKDLAAADDPVQAILALQKEVLKNIQVEFDNWFSEKSLLENKKIESVLEYLKEKEYAYELEGALWFKSTLFGDDKDRVLIKTDGQKTYLVSDIAYHKDKLDRGFTRLINIWGADHHGYIARLQAAIQALTGRKETGLEVILGQLVNLYRNGEPVRMSKRTGEMITLEEVIAEIGPDATRYFLAMRSFDSTLDFDLELAKKHTNDNPVYYVQYAHARICSILRQEEVQAVQLAPHYAVLEKSERNLLLKLIRLPEEIENIAQYFTIHRLPAFAEELAKLFHNFYHDCRVITEDKQTMANRLALIKAARTVLKIILDLLAVTAPEKM